MQSVFKTTQPVQQYTKFQIGAPLPKAKFFATQILHLVNQSNEVVNARISPLQLWPDQSIKWIKCEGIFIQSELAEQALCITNSPYPVEAKRDNWVKEDHSTLKVNTAIGEISVNLTKFYSLNLHSQVSATCQVEFTNTKTTLDSLSTQYDVVYDSQQRPLCCHITQTINVIIENALCAKLNANFSIYYADGNIISTISIHNTQAIVAHGGQWDLGNENSLYIKSFAVALTYDGKSQAICVESGQEKQSYDYAQVTQYSSGGDNWRSENHKTRNNKVELQHKGAMGSIIKNDQTLEFETLRPQPFMQIELGQTSLFVQSKDFWQKYPTGIRSSSKRTVVDFADQKSGCEVELQPGEIKSHTLSFSLGKTCSAKQMQLDQSICLQVDNIQQSQTLPFFNKSLLDHPLQILLCESTQVGESDNKWLAKREVLDEFGWRNYGDLFADHEAANHKGEDIFVSHYNNQYDPLLGFLKLWLLTGRPEYKVLADELFDHTVNIDIYHTTSDKPEYNKGLFWHTDHYVPAETASHRTYSQHQASNVYMDHAGGGGPGSHHCYSTGLAFYYLLSGNEQAKQATLGLCEWMQSIYEGDGTLLGLIIRAKNANYAKFPFTNKLVLGAGTGVLRNVFTNKYPLDRGTGNNINVLLDSFELTQQQFYLRQAEYVILNTISATDDINKRHFDNIEETWFYTVFLQAVAKYLRLICQSVNKNSNHLPTSIVNQVKEAFIHYANWMSDNETYYLANKAVLEYPNDTWTGQDLRKIQVLLCAYEISKNDKLLQKANELIDYVYPSLLTSEEKNYTRIQALIMQNYTDLNSITGHFDELALFAKPEQALKKAKVNKSYFARIISFFKKYSISREFELLSVRIPAVKKVLRK